MKTLADVRCCTSDPFPSSISTYGIGCQDSLDVTGDGTIVNVTLNLHHDLQRRLHEFETVSKGIEDVNAAISFQRLILNDCIPPVLASFDKCRKISHNEGRMRLLQRGQS